MKKGIVKRFLSVLLVLVMVVSVLPMAAMAAGFQSMTVSGKTVNVGFGATLDPTTVLPGYDIKAVAAIKVGYDADAENNLSAEGAVEMLIPKSVFDGVIEEKATSMVSGRFDLNDPNSTLSVALAKTYSETRTVSMTVDIEAPVEFGGNTYTVTVPGVSVSTTVTLAGTATDIICELLTSDPHQVTFTAQGTYTHAVYGSFDYDETVVKDVVYRDHIDAEALLAELAKKVLGNTSLKDTKYGIPAWAAATVAAYDTNGTAGVNDQLAQLAAVYAAYTISKDGDYGVTVVPLDENTKKYKTLAALQQEFIDKIIESANSAMGDVIDGVYADPVWEEFTLREWFEWYEGELNTALEKFKVSMPDLPTQQIADLEDMLKGIVAKLNGTTADAETLNRKIIGKNANDALTSSNETGIYVVAGVDMDGTYAYEIYVVAPDVIDMRTAIEKNGADAGYVINHTYDGSAAPVGVNSAFVNEDLIVRYVGVETDGGTYNAETAPTNAGVYTVFALSLNKETLRMGGDVAMLVIEPAQTGDYYFTEVDKVVTVPAGSTEEYFPALVTNPYMNITVATNAVDKNGENVAYVNLPEGFADIVGVYTDHAGNLLTKIEADTALPMPNYLAGRVLSALDNAAKKAGNGGSITAEEFHTIVTNYLTKVEEWYDSEDVLDRAGDMVDKVKESLAENETVKQYLSLFESLQDSFENMPFHARAVGQVTYGVQASSEADKLGSVASKFLDRFMEEADISKDDVRALLQSLLNSIENSSYMHDAKTLVKTLCTIFRVDEDTVTTALADVEEDFNDLKAGVKALDIDVTDPKIADAEAVLDLISNFIGDVKAVVNEAIKDVDLDVVYFGKNPSAPGKYNCYAVNIAANYVPAMATTTLTIELEETGLFDIAGANLKAGDSLDMFFYVKKADLDGTDYYAVVTKTFADGRDDVVRVIPYAEWEDYNSSLLRFGFDDISAKEMTDEIYVTVYNSDDTAASNQYVDSVQTYALRALNAFGNEDGLLTALVDMLNYGAAAQNYFDYNEKDLATVGAEGYQQYATTSVEYQDSRVPGDNYVGTSVSAKNKLVLTFYFENVTTDMTAYVTYTDHYGNEENLTVNGSDFYQRGSYYGVDVTGLAIADGRQLVACVVKDTDGNVVASAADSVESYVARIIGEDVVFGLLMKFVDSAYNYFENTK